MHRNRRAVAAAAGLAAALAAPAPAAAADALFGLTDDNRIVRFNSDAPGKQLGAIAVQGLQPGETLVGLDVRPANDHLYAVGTSNRVYQVNPTTGQTRPAFDPFTPGLTGVSYGVDFNPAADALRIVSDADQNLRIPFGGGNAGRANDDGRLQYAGGDANAGQNPSVGGAGYTNSFPGTSSTTLFALDAARDVLVTINPPNAGTLNTVGPLGVDVEETLGFDVSVQGNVGFAAVAVRGAAGPALYRIDLSSGRATPAAEQARIASDRPLRGIAVAAGAVPDDGTPPQLSIAFSSTILEQNTDVLRPSISCDEACTVTVEATVQGRDAGNGSGALGAAGRQTVAVPLDATARRRIARPGTELIALRVAAADATGNRVELSNRRSRTQTARQRLGG